jgi:hypothetical protein
MSARAVTLWFIDTDDPAAMIRAGLVNDVTAAGRLATALYGDATLLPVIDTDLASAMTADDSHVYVGHYGPLSVISCSLFATERPADLTRTIVGIQPSAAAAVLLYTDPETGTGTFARWENGTLKRSFSATPVDLFDDQGLPEPFERPFWAGERPLRYAEGAAPDPLALPFHPQQMAEDANRAWLGFRFTHPLAPTDTDPSRIPVTGFAIHPADYPPTPDDLARYHSASARTEPTSEPGPADIDPDTGLPVEPRRRGRLARYFGFGKD